MAQGVNMSPWMKHVSITIFLLFAAAIVQVTAADSTSMTECETRCQPLTGEARYRCIKTCLSSKRKSETVPDAHGQGSYKDCEASCSSLTGLENVQCIRACMENKRASTPIKKDSKIEKPAAVTACESRCEVLTGELRDKCLARCKKEKYGEYRDPLRIKK
jgi:hypothetical protein